MTTSRTISTLAALALAACAAPAHAGAPKAPAAGNGCFAAPAPAQTTTVRAATARPSYDWPLKPFDRQHPVRGFFNDPRDGANGSHSFHFGIDIAASDGTPVYAVRAGTIYLSSARAVAVVDRPGHVLSYWHVVPVVRQHQSVERHQLLGYVEAPWKHVHFAERVDGRYVNPLRAGGLGPYRDATAPTIRGIDARVDPDGRISITADAFDTPPTVVPAPWHGLPVTPVLVRWRLAREGSSPGRWRVGVDFRRTLLPAQRFRAVYGRGSRKNAPGRPGRYCLIVAQRAAVGSGSFRLQVAASDTAGNTTTAVVAFAVPPVSDR